MMGVRSFRARQPDGILKNKCFVDDSLLRSGISYIASIIDHQGSPGQMLSASSLTSFNLLTISCFLTELPSE